MLLRKRFINILRSLGCLNLLDISNLLHVCGDSFHAFRSPWVSGVEMKIYERSLQALLSSAPRSRVLARLTSLAQIGELARRLSQPELSIDNVPIEKVTSIKSLGIFIDENLRWQTHIDKLSK